MRLSQLVVERLDALPQCVRLRPQLLDLSLAIDQLSVRILERFLNSVRKCKPVRDDAAR